MRSFEYNEAVLARVPLLLGIIGHSGSGKTMSALRLATGIQRVCGGDIAVIDTEAYRATHYAKSDRFPNGFIFRHVPMDAPFGSRDYLDAIRFCVSKGAGTIVVDQISFEHDGEGGYLDTHEKELKTKKDPSAWKKPKSDRRALINGVLTLGVNAIFLFRAQQKLDWKNKTDGQPTDMGTQPIAGASFIYEMTARFLLPPGSDGVPAWHSDIAAENDLLKRPSQFRELFEKMRGKPLSEEYGVEMANWAQGTLPAAATALAEIEKAETIEALNAAVARAQERKTAISKADKEKIGAAAKARKIAIESAPPPEEEDDAPTSSPSGDEPPADWQPSAASA